MASTMPLDLQPALEIDLAESQAEGSEDLSNSEQPQQLATDRMFPLFPKLPSELRFLIWEMLLPEPRCIEVKRMTNQPSRDGTTHWTLHDPKPKPPLTLSISRESRQVTLKHYHSFAHGEPPGDKRIAYIDPSRDTLLCIMAVSGKGMGFLEIAKMIPQLSKLAIMGDSTIYSQGCINSNIKHLSSLAELYLLPNFAHSHGYTLFEDMSSSQWEFERANSCWPQKSHLEVQQAAKTSLRALEEEDDGHGKWVAPAVRIGRFVPHLGYKPRYSAYHLYWN